MLHGLLLLVCLAAAPPGSTRTGVDQATGRKDLAAGGREGSPVPFAGSYVVHSGAKVYSYYAKRSASDLAEIAVKNLDEAQDLGEEWVKISNAIPYEDANAATVRQELEASIDQIDKTDARKVVELRGVASGVGNWLSKLDNLGLTALKTEINES